MDEEPKSDSEQEQFDACLAQAIREEGTPMSRAQSHWGAAMWTAIPAAVLWFTGWASPWWALVVYPVALIANTSEERDRAQRIEARVEELTKDAADEE